MADPGASPNKLVAVTDNLAATTLPATETFVDLKSAGFGEKLNGVSLAPFVPVYTLSATPSGTVPGGQTATISSVPAGINCTWNGTTAGGVCAVNNELYGTQVVLSAALPVGTTVTWGTGCDASTATTCTINSLTANAGITASFAATPVNGACGADDGKTLAAAAPGNLCLAGSASAVTGSGHPWNWSCAGVNGGATTNCSAQIQSYNLTFATDGHGTLSGAASQTVDFGGSTSAVSASANANYSFLNWTGSNGFVTTGSNPLTVTNVTASQTITANFKGNVTAGFAPGDIVVLRAGDGSAALSSAATAAFLDEYKADGTLVQSIALPTAANGTNKPLTVSGSATSEGALRRSVDGHYLTAAGYAAAPGTASVNGTTSAATNRVVARIDAGGAIDTSTSISNLYSANNIRGAITGDGTGFWTTGPTSGVGYVPFGGSTGTQLSTTITNTRVPGILNGQLYVSSATGAFQGISAAGTGLPTAAGQTIALLSGFPTASGPSPYSFYMPDANTIYVADDRATASGGIQKWTLNAATWTLAKTMNNGLTANSGVRGLTGMVSGSNVVLYATTSDAPTKLVTVTDDGSAAPAFTILATAPANTAFRGVDLAPISALAPVNGACGGDNNQILTTLPVNLCAAGSASAISGNGHPWNWSCAGLNGGGTANNCSASIQSYGVTFTTDGNGSIGGTASQTVDVHGATTSVTASPNGGYSFLNWTGTAGFTTTTQNPLVVGNVTAAQTITAHFSAAQVNGVCGTDNGKTLAALAPSNLCSSGTASAVTGGGHPWNWSCAGANGGTTSGCSAAIQSYTLTFSTDGNGTITGPASQTVDFGGSTAPVSAGGNDNFSFFNWTGGNGFTTTGANPLTIANVAASQTVTANFKGGFTIFHVNDTHARITPHKWVVTEHDTDPPVFEDVGGAAFLAGEMLQLTAAQPNSLVIDAGDISEGNPVGDMNGNGSMTQFYALLSSKLKSQRGRGMDAVIVGNHDVRDASYIANMVALQNSGVPVISANVRDINTHLPYFPPYTTVTVNGTKVGILGYTTSASEVGASLSSTLEVVACDWSGTSAPCHLADYVNELRNQQGCDVVVLAAHVGHSALVDPAAPLLVDDGKAKLPEIAVTGHWHTWSDTVWQPYMLNYKTIFTESASYMKYIGELKVSSTGGYLSSVQHVIRDADITPDPDVQTLVGNLTAQYDTAHPGHPADEVIGYTADNLMLDNSMKWWSADEYPWSGNNTAGQWICDAMRWKAEQLFGQCDLSMEAGGGVRADIPAGPVTYMQIYETFPWNDDTFYRVNMTGQDIVNFLKQTTMDAGFSSALDVTAFDGTPTSVKFNGQPIDPNRTYTVAINNYMYNNPPSGWTWSDTAPLTSSVLCRDGIVDFMRQFPIDHPYQVGGARYHLNTDFSGGYRAVVTMMNDNDSKPTFDDAFVRFLSATPETLARRGGVQVPADLVNADGSINPKNRLSEQELFRSYLGFKPGALKPGDIIETWGKEGFYGGNPEFVDQEGVYGDGAEFKIVGHDDSLSKPAFMSSIGSFMNDSYKNHYVQFLAKKTGASTVADQNGQTLSVMDVTAYTAKTLPGNVGDTLLISGVPTMESYALRFRCDQAATSTGQLPAASAVSSHLDPTPAGTTGAGSQLTLSATAAVNASTYLLAPSADAQIASGKPTVNTNNNNLYVQSASSANSYGNERDWLKFDLSGLPSGTAISSAVLQLWDWKAAGASLPTEVRGGVDDGWTETGITWSSQPAFGAALDTQTLVSGTSNLWYNWDVTSFVVGKLAADKLVSLVVKPVAEGATDATPPSYAFDSKEYGSNAPVLRITSQATGSSVRQVEFFYRYSTDGTTWGGWTSAAISTAAPYGATFSYPQGTGYYEFYSQATDSNGNVEPAPAGAQAATHYSDLPAYYPIISIGGVLQKYDGSPKGVTVTTIPANTPVTLTYDGGATKPTALGMYTVTATGSFGGNTVSTNGTMTIMSNLPQAAPTVTLTGATAGAGSGTISGVANPYSVWSVATITANPAGGSSFAGWSGCSTSTAATIDLTMDTGKSCTANFILTPVTGACGGSNGGTFTAMPANNLCNTGSPSALAGSGPWNWSCAGANGGTTANCSAGIQSYAVTFTTGGNGTLNGVASQTISYGASAATVTAVPANGYHFVNWTEGATVVGTTAALAVDNVATTHNYTANFAADPINGACGSSNGGTFTAMPANNLCAGGSAAAPGGTGPWSWTCVGSNGGTTASCSAAIQSYTVTFVSNGHGTLNGTASQTVLYGGNAAEVVAVPSGGYRFVNWTEGTTAIGTSASLTIGNVSANRSIAANFADAAAPTMSLNASTLTDGAITNNATLNVAGTVTDVGSGVKSLTVNGQVATLNGDGSFSVAVTLVDGANAVTTTATDNAGNQTTDLRTITLDRTAPGLTIASPADNSIIGKNSVDVVGSVDDANAVVAAKVNGGTPIVAAKQGTAFSVTLNLIPGTNTLDLTATDLAGNSTSAKRTIKSDTTAPTLVVSIPPQDISTTLATLTMVGSVTDVVTIPTISIAFDGQTYAPAVAGDGSFSQVLALPAIKTYAIVVTATDQAGNTNTVQRNVVKTAPAVLGDMNGDGIVDIVDVMKVLQIAVGLATARADDYAKADVAPLKDGKPAPDGVIDVADALVLLEKAVGLVNW